MSDAEEKNEKGSDEIGAGPTRSFDGSVKGPGEQIGPFRIEQELGRGAVGVVYLAHDTKLDRQVAIKSLPAEMMENPKARSRFAREAKVLASLNHPNIATIYEQLEEAEGVGYLVLEYVPGQTLAERIASGPLKLQETLTIALQIAEAVAAAHEHDVIHRDLKPGNIKITPEGKVKVLDFGLAKAVGGEALDQQTTITQPGRVIGTPAYMSPEQARGKPTDKRSDIWSFGCVLYEMLTGRIPFKGETISDTLANILQTEANLEMLPQSTPANIQVLLRRCLEKDPRRRLQHIGDASIEIDETLRSTAAPITTASSISVKSEIARKAKLRKMAMIIGAAIIIGAALYFVFRSGRVPPEQALRLGTSRAIGVIGFENLTDPKDSDHLGRMLMGLITTDLAEVGGLNVVSTVKVLTALKKVGRSPGNGFDATLAAEAARMAGAQIMLVGQVGKTGERLLLMAELVDVETGNTLGSHKKQAESFSELFSLAGAIAAEVRDRLGAGAGARGFNLAQALTTSPEAYRQYAAGQIALHQDKWSDAADCFERAIRADPTFASAYYLLGMSYWWEGSSDKTETALQDGLQYVDRLPERWQVVYRAFIDFLHGKIDSAYESLQELVKSSSDIPDAYYILGEIATHASRYRDALKAREFFEKALEIDPTFKIVFFHLFDTYVHGADLPAADRLLARYRQEDANDPALADPEVVILMAKGQFDAAAARAEELVARGHSQALFRLFQAHLLAGNWEHAHRVAENAILRFPPGFKRAIAFSQRGFAQIAQGHLRAGLSDLREAMDQLRDEKVWTYTADFASFCLIHQALVLEAAGDIEAAVKDSQEAIRTDPLFHPAYFWLGRILLGAGRTEQAQDVFQELKAAAQETLAPTGRFWVHLLQAELHLAAGRPMAAEAELERASRFAPEHRDRGTQWLVRARVEAASGELSGAITSYGRIFELDPSLSTLSYYSLGPWVVTTTRALYAMARLEEEAGDLASARQHYRQFLARWGEADLPIPEVQEAKSRLAKLESQ